MTFCHLLQSATEKDTVGLWSWSQQLSAMPLMLYTRVAAMQSPTRVGLVRTLLLTVKEAPARSIDIADAVGSTL